LEQEKPGSRRAFDFWTLRCCMQNFNYYLKFFVELAR